MAAGRAITATATATANDGRSLVSSGWDVTGDRVIDQAGGRLRIVPRTTAPLAISFIAVDDTGASSVASFAPTVARAPKMTILLTSSVRQTILRSGIAGVIRRPPSGNVSLTISVGRLQQGRLRPAARARCGSRRRATSRAASVFQLGRQTAVRARTAVTP